MAGASTGDQLAVRPRSALSEPHSTADVQKQADWQCAPSDEAGKSLPSSIRIAVLLTLPYSRLGYCCPLPRWRMVVSA